MVEWYRFEPQDTLFFRGAEPAVMGENHTVSSNFPPPPHTLSGALRTAALLQNGVKYSDYKKEKCETAIIEAIGKAGTDSPFGIIGPLFETAEGIWLPCPYTWFAEIIDIRRMPQHGGQVNILHAAPIKSGAIELKTSSEKLMWIKGKEPKSLGGFWVASRDMAVSVMTKNIKGSDTFFMKEPHTGLALEYGPRRRTARKHHLYSFIHARLKKDVKIVFGVTAQLPLATTGILKIGAEQRFGRYEKINDPKLPRGASGLFMALSIMEGDDNVNSACVATGKIRYFGGWDLNKAFHKPMRGYFPAGTVFNQSIKDHCIEL